MKISLNRARIIKKAQAVSKKLQFTLDEQVIKDSNYYCPKAEGTLQSSAIKDSDVGTGKVQWTTPYAKRLYYGEDFQFSKDRNPNARAKWFEEAKSKHKKEWLSILNKDVKTL